LNPIDTASTVIRMSGTDALDVLQRISTQNLATLEPGVARPTLFCDFRAHLLHRALVVRSSDAVWLLHDLADAADLLAHIDRHVFREKVALENLSAQWRVRAAWDDGPPSVTWNNGVPMRSPEGHGCHLVLEPAAGTPVPASREFEDGERKRILAGRPRHGHEIHTDFTPFEIGAGDEVHLSKGCYTGQETLQRLITYGSVRRRPLLVRGRGAPPHAPIDIAVADATGAPPAGRLTSAASDGNDWVGFAVVRNEALEAVGQGAALAVDGDTRVSVARFPDRPPLGRGVGPIDTSSDSGAGAI
jgi:tRNA-modifying protein YgfZ